MKRLALTILATAAVAAQPVSAQTSYPDFSSTTGLQINGDAYQNGNKLTLTPALDGQSGSAFSLNRISLASNASFSTVFNFEILNRGGYPGWGIVGADGLTFTMQTVSNNVGGGGGGIGYQGIDNSVAVEFDTYNNGFSAEGNFAGSNHVGINAYGSVYSLAAVPSGTLNHSNANVQATDFDNGLPWWAWVDYDGTTDLLSVRWAPDAVRPASSMLSMVIDVVSILESTDVFVGFTAGTGAGWGEHNILSWNFLSTFEEEGAPLPTTVPEPGTVFLLGTGLAITMMGRRFARRRNDKPSHS